MPVPSSSSSLSPAPIQPSHWIILTGYHGPGLGASVAVVSAFADRLAAPHGLQFLAVLRLHAGFKLQDVFGKETALVVGVLQILIKTTDKPTENDCMTIRQ